MLSIMPDIRSETSGTNQGKMEGQFSSRVNFQPDRSVPFTFRTKFRLLHSEVRLETRIFVSGTARFGRTRPTGQRGPPPAMVPNIPVGPNRNGTSIRLQPEISGNFGVMESTYEVRMLQYLECLL